MHQVCHKGEEECLKDQWAVYKGAEGKTEVGGGKCQ